MTRHPGRQAAVSGPRLRRTAPPGTADRRSPAAIPRATARWSGALNGTLVALSILAVLALAGRGFAADLGVGPALDLDALQDRTVRLLQRVASSVCRVTVVRGDYEEEWARLFQQYADIGLKRFKLATRQHVIMSHSSCVVVDAAQGLVVSNEHVVRGLVDYDHFEMQLAGAKDRVPLTLLGTDRESDLAVLRVADQSRLPLAASSVVWGNSSAVKPGELVVAIGYPGRGYELAQDTYYWNAAFGIVSGLARTQDLTEFLQTTANTDKGYSGGGVFNLRGECLGIASEAEGRGLNFAVSSNLVRRVVDEIVAHGRVRRGGLGTVWDEVKWMRPIDAAEVGITVDVWRKFIDKGLAVLSVAPGSAADRAGIRPGDIVLRIDGTPAVWSAGMQWYIAAKRPDDVVTVEVFRPARNESLVLPVVLQDRDAAVKGLQD